MRGSTNKQVRVCPNERINTCRWLQRHEIHHREVSRSEISWENYYKNNEEVYGNSNTGKGLLCILSQQPVFNGYHEMLIWFDYSIYLRPWMWPIQSSTDSGYDGTWTWFSREASRAWSQNPQRVLSPDQSYHRTCKGEAIFLYVDKMDTWSNSAYNTSWLAIAAKIRLYSYYFGYYRQPTSNIYIYILCNIIPKMIFMAFQVSRLLLAVESGVVNKWKGLQLADIDIDGMCCQISTFILLIFSVMLRFKVKHLITILEFARVNTPLENNWNSYPFQDHTKLVEFYF